MSTYKVIDSFPANSSVVLSLDRELEESAIGMDAYVNGEKYDHYLNSVKSWIVLPGVSGDFSKAIVEFR